MVRNIVTKGRDRGNTVIDAANGETHMSSGNGAVDVVLWLAAITLLIAFGSALSTKDWVTFAITGVGLLVCLVVQQYLKKADRRARSDDG